MLSTAFLLAAYMVVGQAGDVNVPKEVLSEFQFLVGDWEYTGESQEGAVKGTLSGKWASGEHAILFEMSWTDRNHTTLGTGMHGWDAADKKLVALEFWSDGWSHFRRFTIKSPGVWQSDEWRGVDGKGQRVTGIAIVERQGPNKFNWRSENSTIGGEPVRETNITFVRK